MCGLSLVAASGATLPGVHRLLTVVASLVAKRRLLVCVLMAAPLVIAAGLETAAGKPLSTGSGAHKACGIFLDQESNLCLLHWQADFYPLDH